MEETTPAVNTVSANNLSNKIHSIFAHCYFLYFLLFLLGVFLDLIFPLKLFTTPIVPKLGFIFIILATALVFWEQRVPKHIDTQNLSRESFCRGPYCYTRHPGHWGIFFLVLGFGLVMNAFFIIFLTLLSFVITKLVYLKKHELVLIEKYGQHYIDYKKKVKF